LAALAVVPCTVAALLSVLAVLVLTRASHAPLLQGHALAALVVLGIVLLAVIMASFVWAARVAEAVKTGASDQVGVAYPPEVESPAPGSAALSARPEIAETEVFVHLSRRLQSLVARQIGVLDDLESQVEDPGLLKGLFAADHLATRMRRHAEGLGVLGGALPRRQWTKPVSLSEVLRSAVSETVNYPRVQVIADAAGLLNGYAVADVVHLLAELVENATNFSPPETKVTLHTQSVAAGLAIEIDDRGFGMTPQEYGSLNALLREPAPISVQQLLKDARIGLYVVARLARGRRIAVQLEKNVFGGTRALVVLPKALLADDPEAGSVPAGAQAPAAESEAWRPGEAGAGDGSADAGFAPAAARSAPVPGGVLPAPRRAVDGQAVAVSTGTRSADSDVQAPHAYVPETRNPAPRPTPDASATLNRPQTQAGSTKQAEAVRPPLPNRRPQQHLTPLLAAAQPSPGPDDRVSDGRLTPGLMAGFRQGMARGYGQSTPENPSDEHAPTQEGQ
jgi:hypothetical protein